MFAAARSAAPAGRFEGGPRGPRPRPSPGGAARLSALSARVAARGGCAGGAAVGLRGASAGGLACSVRGVARLGGGGSGGCGGDTRRAAAAPRALGSGDAREGSAYNDKLAAARAARAQKPTQGGGEGGRAAGSGARGARGGGGANTRGGSGGGDARRGGRCAGGGGGRAAAIALNRRITEEESPEGLLRLVADELPSFDGVNVATAFSKLGKLYGSRSFPGNLAGDDNFRGLMVLVS
jgi:hypothetical protein